MKKKIFLVEDDFLIQELLLEVFQEDYDVCVNGKCEEVFKYLKENTFDCIIMDYHLQNFTAFDILSRFKEKEFLKKTIITSGYLSYDEELNIKNLGVFQIIQKPFDLFELKRQVDQLV